MASVYGWDSSHRNLLTSENPIILLLLTFWGVEKVTNPVNPWPITLMSRWLIQWKYLITINIKTQPRNCIVVCHSRAFHSSVSEVLFQLEATMSSCNLVHTFKAYYTHLATWNSTERFIPEHLPIIMLTGKVDQLAPAPGAKTNRGSQFVDL